MKRWTRTEDLALLAAASDDQLQALHPDVKLSTLQRRRRMLRAQPALSAGNSLSIEGLEESHFDPLNFKAVVVGDLQSPFHDTRALASFNHLLQYLTDRGRIDVLINNGDHYDNYAISRFHKSSGRGSPEAFIEEVKAGTDIFREWRDIVGPSVDIILHKGNHEDRWDRYLETADLDHLYALAGDRLSFESVYGLDGLGVIVIPYKKPTVYGEVIITHGTTSSKNPGSKVLQAVREKFGKSVIINHIHTGALVAQRYIDGTRIGVENFTLCNVDGLDYAEFPNWTQGFTYLVTHNGRSYLRPVVMVDQTFEFDGLIFTPEGVIE